MKLIALITIIVMSFTGIGFASDKGINKAFEQLGNDLAELAVELEEIIPEWYEGKRFDINSLGRTYLNVIILDIIHINEHNVILMFMNGDGYIIYLPFHRITYMYKVE